MFKIRNVFTSDIETAELYVLHCACTKYLSANPPPPPWGYFLVRGNGGVPLDGVAFSRLD